MAIQRPRQEQGPIKPSNPYMPDFDSDDYTPPEYRLVQPTSKAHTEYSVPLGSFFCEQTGETTETLGLVILKVQRNRTYWAQNDMSSPACSSDDRVMPRPGGAYPGPCKECPANGNGCYPGYNIFAVRFTPTEPFDPSALFLLRINGTSVFPFRKLWSQIHMNHQDQPWRVALSISSTQQSNDKGTYWVMQPEISEEFQPGDETRNVFKNLADNFCMGGLKERPSVDPPLAIQSPKPQPKPQPMPAPQSRIPRMPLITRQQAEETVQFANSLGVPTEIVRTFIANTFSKDRLRDLHMGEWTMLNKWLQQEFGQVGTSTPLKPEDDLPF